MKSCRGDSAGFGPGFRRGRRVRGRRAADRPRRRRGRRGGGAPLPGRRVFHARPCGPHDPGTTRRLSRSAADESRRSRRTNASAPASSSRIGSAAPSRPASAARNGCRAGSASARARTANISVTSSQLAAKAWSRSIASERCRRDREPSRARLSIAPAISVRVHTHVTMWSSSDSRARTDSLSGSATTGGTSAEASRRLTAGLPDPRPTLPTDSRAAPAAACPG